MNSVYERLLKINSKKDAYDILKDYYYETSMTIKKSARFSILILNTPCNGFGDVVFAMKLYNYLVKWYPNASVKIATPKVDNFLSLGQDPKVLYFLNAGKLDQCRRFQYLKFQNLNRENIEVPIVDLILVAPLQADFKPNISDVKKIIPYANEINTLTF